MCAKCMLAFLISKINTSYIYSMDHTHIRKLATIAVFCWPVEDHAALFAYHQLAETHHRDQSHCCHHLPQTTAWWVYLYRFSRVALAIPCHAALWVSILLPSQRRRRNRRNTLQKMAVAVLPLEEEMCCCCRSLLPRTRTPAERPQPQQ
jgi:hypothetical protein